MPKIFKLFPILFLIFILGCGPKLVPPSKSPITKQTLTESEIEQKYNNFFIKHGDWWIAFCDHLKEHPEHLSKVISKIHSKDDLGEILKEIACDSIMMSELIDVFLINQIPIPDQSQRTIISVGLQQKHGDQYFQIPINDFYNIENNTIVIEPRKTNGNIVIIFQYDDLVGFFKKNVDISIGERPYTASCYLDLDKCYLVLENYPHKHHESLCIGDHGLFVQTVKISIKTLLGDVNNSGFLDDIDRNLIKSKYGETLNETNFIYDINLDGIINENDVLATYYSDVPENTGMKIKIK